MTGSHLKGRGAQFNSKNRFQALELSQEHFEGIDDYEKPKGKTNYYKDFPAKIINKVSSPDLKFSYSMNPYQGCEHGCVYCYARNSHEYWGFSAGLDFESKIIYKPNAPVLLERELTQKNWKPTPIMLSGNTDCYQPLESSLKLTRKMLSILTKYQNPVGLITKNSLILRDLDLLKELADNSLVHVLISITSLKETLRRNLEPRTSTSTLRIKTIEQLSKAGVPVGVMVAPVIPGLNDEEIPDILTSARNAGAIDAKMTVVRLNGSIKFLFEDWLHKCYPDRKDKIWNQIAELHGGQVNDSEWGRRMKGSGPLAEMIADVFKIQKKKLFGSSSFPEYDFSRFRRFGNLNLF